MDKIYFLLSMEDLNKVLSSIETLLKEKAEYVRKIFKLREENIFAINKSLQSW